MQTATRPHSLSDQLAAIVAVLEQSPYAPNAAAAQVLRRIHRELADRETLFLNLADLWRDIARRERERAAVERGARPYHEGYADGGAAVYESVAAQLDQYCKRKEDAR